MKQTSRAITAAIKPGADLPQIEPERPYELKRAGQKVVTFVAKPL